MMGMKTIWKFPFRTAETVTIEMPSGAHILHVGMQDGTPCLWALVDTEEPPISISFRIHGTGRPVDEQGINYIGTYFQDMFVWHVFLI
jgi:hypothetical protein